MGNIQERWLKIKAQGRRVGNAIVGEWGLFILVILAITAAFGLGRLSALMEPKGPISVQNGALAGISLQEGETLIQGAYIGSKTGDLYYFPWCSGAQKIALSQRVWFASEVAAQKAGYRPAKNCKGMSSE